MYKYKPSKISILIIASISVNAYAQNVIGDTFYVDGTSNMELSIPVVSQIQPGSIGNVIYNSMSSSSPYYAIATDVSGNPSKVPGVLNLGGGSFKASFSENPGVQIWRQINASSDSITRYDNLITDGSIFDMSYNTTYNGDRIINDFNLIDDSQLTVNMSGGYTRYYPVKFIQINSESSKTAFINFDKNKLSNFSGTAIDIYGSGDVEIAAGRFWLFQAGEHNVDAALIDTTNSTGKITTNINDDFLSGYDISDGEIYLLSIDPGYSAYIGGAGRDILKLDGGTAGGVFSLGAGDDEFHAINGNAPMVLDMGDGNDLLRLHKEFSIMGYKKTNSPGFLSVFSYFTNDLSKVYQAWLNKVEGGDGTDSIDLISREQNIFSNSTSPLQDRDVSFSLTGRVYDRVVQEYFPGQFELQAINVLGFEKLNVLEGSKASLVGNLNLGGGEGVANIDATSMLGLQRVEILDGATQGLDRKINGSIINSGVVDIASDDIQEFNTLEVISYNGQGGKIKIDTILDDGSAGSDKLIINGGKATGNSKIEVRQKGGLGAETIGKGIQVIEARNGATTNTNAFALSGSVSAGAYVYNLYRNADESWYLSTNIIPPEPVVPGEPNLPDYSDEAFTVSILPSLAQYYGAATLSSWRERMGGLAYADPVKLGKANTSPSPLWVRLGTQHGKHKGGQRFNPTSTSQAFSPQFKYESNFLQMGGDIYQSQNTQGDRSVAGAFLTTGSIHGDAQSFHELNGSLQKMTSTAKLENIAIGGYWTKITPEGSYVDVVGQYIHHDLTTQSGSDKLTASGHSWMASLEAGKAYTVNSEWTLVPQAQLRWQNVHFGDKKALAAQSEVGSYKFSKNQALQARLGLEARYQTEVQRGFWTRLDVLHEFKGNNNVRYTSNIANAPQPEFISSRKGTSLEIIAGSDMQLNENLSMFTSVGYEHGLSSMNKGHAWNANVGIRWGF